VAVGDRFDKESRSAFLALNSPDILAGYQLFADVQGHFEKRAENFVGVLGRDAGAELVQFRFHCLPPELAPLGIELHDELKHFIYLGFNNSTLLVVTLDGSVSRRCRSRAQPRAR
jgi:hypothetical protein